MPTPKPRRQSGLGLAAVGPDSCGIRLTKRRQFACSPILLHQFELRTLVTEQAYANSSIYPPSESTVIETQHLALALTIVNVVLLTFLVARSPSTADEFAPVLRGRALEIVDDRGKVRARH
jgi:hypothetical protein